MAKTIYWHINCFKFSAKCSSSTKWKCDNYCTK